MAGILLNAGAARKGGVTRRSGAGISGGAAMADATGKLSIDVLVMDRAEKPAERLKRQASGMSLGEVYYSGVITVSCLPMASTMERPTPRC